MEVLLNINSKVVKSGSSCRVLEIDGTVRLYETRQRRIL